MIKNYIVVSTAGSDQNTFTAMLTGHGATMLENFGSLARHYYVSFDESKLATILAEATVASIEEDKEVVTLATQTITIDGSGMGDNWGLSRISKRNEWDDTTWYPNSGSFTNFRNGNGVDIYVVDTGARLSHSDFAGRISVIYDHYLPNTDPNYGVDLQGHGTHVASIAAGTKYGIAKNANIKISRVFETGGAALSAIIAGINACLADHNAKKTASSTVGSVMNLSLGGGANAAEEQAVNDAIDAGIVVVAAAGNDGKNLDSPSYNIHPAEVARALTVGSVDIQDKISNFSNYGSILDVFAPGHYITAAGKDADNGEHMLSGTSMAAPHVTGVAALFCEDRSIETGGMGVAVVHDWIVANATPASLVLSANAVAQGTPNLMLHSDYLTSSTAGALPGSGTPVNGAIPGGNATTKKAWRGGGKKRVKAGANERFEKLIADLQALIAAPATASVGVSSTSMTGLVDDLEYYVGEMLAGDRKEAIIGYWGLLTTIGTIRGLLSGHSAIFNEILAEAGLPTF